jgi:hypothetical protein
MNRCTSLRDGLLPTGSCRLRLMKLSTISLSVARAWDAGIVVKFAQLVQDAVHGTSRE